MQLFRYYMVRLLKIASANNVRVKMIGDRARFDRDIIEHLDYYCDYVHHSDEAGALALEKIHSGTDRLTEKNYRETLANWHDFVVNYDYDKFWDDYYWYQFHTPAGAKT